MRPRIDPGDLPIAAKIFFFILHGLGIIFEGGTALQHDYRPILAYDGDIPSEVVIEDKTAVEQLRLIQQLEDEDRQTIFKLIDKMLTNKKF